MDFSTFNASAFQQPNVWILVICCVLILGVAVGVVLFVKRRKKTAATKMEAHHENGTDLDNNSGQTN